MSSRKKKSPEELAQQAPAEDIAEAWNRAARNAVADGAALVQSSQEIPGVQEVSGEPEIVVGGLDPAEPGKDRTAFTEIDGAALRRKFYPDARDSIPALLQAILGELIMLRTGR